MNYLRNSAEIRTRLQALLSEDGPKWAIVAFVGYNALDYLPKNVSNLSVVCWPKAGGTHPDGVRRLIESDIAVYFCDRLHQKIFWREGAGLIVGSANLSDNALGDDGLHEFAVFCPDERFDVSRILSALPYRKVTPQALARLDAEHNAQARRVDRTSSKRDTPLPSFLAATQMRHPKKWKIVTWSELRQNSDHIRGAVEKQFGTKCWTNDNDISSGSFAAGDFVLQVKVNDDEVIERVNARWLLVDLIVRQGRNKVIVQVRPLDGRTPPPFQINSAFKKHFKTAFNNSPSWEEICDEQDVAIPKFLRAIRNAYGEKV